MRKRQTIVLGIDVVTLTSGCNQFFQHVAYVELHTSCDMWVLVTSQWNRL